MKLVTSAPSKPASRARRAASANVAGSAEALNWAVVWLPEGGELVTESYVNLIPTPQGGTHVTGLRAGLTEALREFCEFRNLLPRGVRITPEDVWEPVSFVLSVKMEDPQFSGQTKERLSSRECAAFLSGTVKDSLALWLNQHPDAGAGDDRNVREIEQKVPHPCVQTLAHGIPDPFDTRHLERSLQANHQNVFKLAIRLEDDVHPASPRAIPLTFANDTSCGRSESTTIEAAFPVTPPVLLF